MDELEREYRPAERREKVKKKKKKSTKGRRRGCLPAGCFWILLIIVLIIVAIAAKAYYDIHSTSKQITVDSNYTQMRDEEVDLSRGEDTVTALLLGIDTGDMGRVEQGRSDTMIVMTSNPTTQTTNMVSIPRDTLVEIPGYGQDKINHAYAYGGADLSVEAVQNYFEIPIDYYFAVDMQGLQDVINAVGGVTVVPEITFENSGYYFQAGVPQELDGAAALAYSRERYNDPQGDYGRQARQREIIISTMNKVASLDGIMNYSDVLASLEGSVQTNASFNEMVSGLANYRDSINNVNQHQLTGEGQMINGVYYAIIPDNQFQEVQARLHDEVYQ